MASTFATPKLGIGVELFKPKSCVEMILLCKYLLWLLQWSYNNIIKNIVTGFWICSAWLHVETYNGSVERLADEADIECTLIARVDEIFECLMVLLFEEFTIRQRQVLFR